MFTEIETKDIDLAREAGNHDFSVEKEPLVTESGVSVPDHMAVINSNNGQYLGTVGASWEPVQPSVLYELADELIDSTNGSINGVLDLNGGATIGLSLNLAEREYVPGDPTMLNFIMLLGFNGVHGIAGHATTSRLVCLNQCNASNKFYNLKHTKNVMHRIQVIREMLKYYRNEIHNFDQKMTSFVRHRMDDSEAVEWFRKLWPETKTERSKTKLMRKTEIFLECLQNGKGSEIPGVRGTSYGAFQALTEFVNHHKTIRIHQGKEEEEVRFQSVHFGSGNKIIQRGMGSLEGSFTLDADDFLIE